MKRRRGKGIEDANSRDNHQTRMAGRTRWIHNDVLVDRISDNAIDSILNRPSLRNIIKTSVLSKNWRHCWTRSIKLEFDSEFYWNIVSENKQQFEKVIDSVLSQHHGSADKFLICYHSFFPRKSLDVSQWLTKLTEKGVKEFTLLAYKSGCIKISSELFKCPRLERVILRNCEVICSDNLENFGNVVYLYLEAVTISDESLELLISKFPLLETLDITFIKHGRGRPFVVNAPKLKTLSFNSIICSRPLRLKYFPSLNVVRLISELEIRLNYPEELKLSRFINQLPNIEKMVICPFALISLAAGILPKQISRTLDHQKHLELGLSDISFLDQIMCAFCLIRSSPNLQSLEIHITKPTYPEKQLAAADFLQGQVKKGTLSRIKTVKFAHCAGFSYEYHLLIKAILCCYPMLENVYFDSETSGTHASLVAS